MSTDVPRTSEFSIDSIIEDNLMRTADYLDIGKLSTSTNDT